MSNNNLRFQLHKLTFLNFATTFKWRQNILFVLFPCVVEFSISVNEDDVFLGWRVLKDNHQSENQQMLTVYTKWERESRILMKSQLQRYQHFLTNMIEAKEEYWPLQPTTDKLAPFVWRLLEAFKIDLQIKVGWVLKNSGNFLFDRHWNFTIWTKGSWDNWV